jgi:hypothetical protein
VGAVFDDEAPAVVAELGRDLRHRGNRANDWIEREQYHAHTLTLKMRLDATHFLMKRLPKVATEMALHMFAYNLTGG